MYYKIFMLRIDHLKDGTGCPVMRQENLALSPNFTSQFSSSDVKLGLINSSVKCCQIFFFLL